MLIADIITEEDRLRYEALPDGPTKRGYARRYDNEVLKRMGYLIGEPSGPTPGWRLFPDDAVEITHKQLTVKKAFGLQQGFTLIELAAVMMIAGLALAAFLGFKRVEIIQHKIDVTKTNVDQVQQALNAYEAKNGFYPCPAPMDAKLGEEQFARAGQCDNGLNPVTLGQCSGGHCVRAGRLFDHDSNPVTALQPLRVRIGSVPAADLGLRPDQIKDAYGNILLYAVTERLAIDKPTAATVDGGGIEVIDQNGDSLLDTPQTAHYVVLSHGRDNAGAIVYGTGITAAPCPAGKQQTENCNLSVNNQPATFRMAPWSTADGSEKFDDTIAWNLPITGGSPAVAGEALSTTPLTLMGESSCPAGYGEVYKGSRIAHQPTPSGSNPAILVEDMCVADANLRVCGADAYIAFPCSSGSKTMGSSPSTSTSLIYYKHSETCVVCVPQSTGG